MRPMEPSTPSQPAALEPTRTDTTKTGGIEKAYGDRHFKPVVTPGIFKGPILPVWLSKRFRRKSTPATP
jgi:hypothetical protein